MENKAVKIKSEGEKMKTLKSVVSNPSGFDSLNNYVGEIPAEEWLCLLTQSRDSDCLTRSNFTSALKALGGESESVKIDRFVHWACGWWESLSVLNGSEAHKKAEEIERKLADYPVVNEAHYSELQWEEATNFWASIPIKERVKLCQRFRIPCLQARHDWIPQNDDGCLFEYLCD